MKTRGPARILCLADSGVAARAAALAEQALGAPPAVLKSFRQLRQEPAVTLRLPFQRFDAVLAYLTDVEAPLYRDFILAYLWLLRAPHKALRDIQGKEVVVTAAMGLRAVLRCAMDLLGLPLVYGQARWTVRTLSRGRHAAEAVRPSTGRIAYLRANLWQESRAGGSLAHTAGVLAGFRAARLAVTYIGAAPFPPAERLATRVEVLPPGLARLQNLPDLPFVAYSGAFARRCLALVRGERPDFVYQRHSILNCAGAWLAERLGCPFVLEYNGSEVWIARHWSTPLLFEGLAARMEEANLRRANLVVVVSKALRDEVASRGIPPERVLVNPNGVDPTRYHPGIDGCPIRAQCGLAGKLVIGFVGTFGPWHGAEVLAKAVRPVAACLPEAHFLFVGDGSGMPQVREIIANERMDDRVTFTGLVPQDEAPGYLAACDILASPHVGNADGSPFFGSPTKLFEYMAMGKGIVASDLDQIGELLAHGTTAWLVKPGDSQDLAEGIVKLGKDAALRRDLGDAARAVAVARHTWTAHVERILHKMTELELVDPSVLDRARSGEA